MILAGALYALLLAWSRLREQRWAAIGAYLAYGLLALSVLTLGSALNLTGPWRIIVITMLVGYFAVQKWRGGVWMSGGIANAWPWKWALALLNIGVMGMTMALLIAGYEQSFIERAIEGSTWQGYVAAQSHPWFVASMEWRQLFGWVTAAGVILLVWDLLTIGAGETRTAREPGEETAEEAASAPAVA